MPDFSLGWELEAIRGARRPLKGILIDHDGSVRGEQLEYKTKRATVFDPQESIRALRMLTTDPWLNTDDSCGFHVHIGLGKRYRRGTLHPWAAAFITLARHIEQYAFDAVPPSRTQSQRAANYCRPWAHDKAGILDREYPSNKYSGPGRYNWVNPVEIFRPGGIRTIEVRLMGHSHRFLYLLSWASFCRIMAQKAWIVSHDISREQECIDELTGILITMKSMFRENHFSQKDIARKSVWLAYLSGIYLPFGRPLENLKESELNASYQASLEESEGRNLRRILDQMDASIEDNRRRIRDGQVISIAGILPGDTVECVEVPRDGNLTIGRRYRVVEVNSNQLRVVGDDSRAWYVNNVCVTLIERLEGAEVCAV